MTEKRERATDRPTDDLITGNFYFKKPEKPIDALQ